MIQEENLAKVYLPLKRTPKEALHYKVVKGWSLHITALSLLIVTCEFSFYKESGPVGPLF